MSVFIGILIGILSLSIMMLVHEFGHFWTGLKLGFKVQEFSLFMGPRLFTWVSGGIRYSVKLLPIGASVSFAGEMGEADDESDDSIEDEEAPGSPGGYFMDMAPWRRAIVIFAGPAVNLICAILAFILYFSLTGYNSNTIAQVAPNSIAQNIGIHEGDRILSIGNRGIHTDLDLFSASQSLTKGQTLSLTILSKEGKSEEREVLVDEIDKVSLGISVEASKDNSYLLVKSATDVSFFKEGDKIFEMNGKYLDLQSLTTFLSSLKDSDSLTVTYEREGLKKTDSVLLTTKKALRPLGISLEKTSGFWGSIPYSFQYSKSIIVLTGKMIAQVFTGASRAQDALAGPIGIVSVYGSVVGDSSLLFFQKLLFVIQIFGLISLSLGVMNLLPIPPLDGSILCLIALEVLRRKPLSKKGTMIFNLLGFFIIISLALLAVYFDLARLFG